MTTKIEYNLEEMFDHACAFAECGDLCKEKITNGGNIFTARPEIVNYSFACEVFLKILLLIDKGKLERCHTLVQLFENLPQKTQEEIQSEVVKKSFKWCDTFGFPLLNQISDAFVNWRYCYECNPRKGGALLIDLGFLYAFCDTLRGQCCEKVFHMTWAEYQKRRG